MSEVHEWIVDIYAETRDMREEHRAGLGPLYDLGFKILHAPPNARPPLLFIGIQPGGKVADTASGEMFRWPERFDYEAGQWGLAKYIKGLFRDSPELLMSFNVTNVNFFRAQHVKKDLKHPSKLTWDLACLPTRKALAKFCGRKLEVDRQKVRAECDCRHRGWHTEQRRIDQEMEH